MTPAERRLGVAVMRASETTAAIMTAMVRASHGAERSRIERLEIAERQARYLRELIQTTKLELERLEQNSDAPKESQP